MPLLPSTPGEEVPGKTTPGNPGRGPQVNLNLRIGLPVLNWEIAAPRVRWNISSDGFVSGSGK